MPPQLTRVLRFAQDDNVRWWFPIAGCKSKILYNGLVPETKPFRLTESVKAAG